MLSGARLALPVASAIALLATAGLAHATGSPLGIGTAEPSFQPIGGPLAPLFLYVNTEQQAFYRALTQSLAGMRQGGWQLWSLFGLSFAYGVFHAAGPGHGKAVISSYMVANEVALRRGIAISFVSAFLQGLMAVLVVIVAYFALRGSGITMTEATNTMEIASFVMVIAFGGWLLFRKMRALFREFPRGHMAAFATPAGPVSLALFEDAPRTINRASSSARSFSCDDAADASGGFACEQCGRSHLPDPSLLSAERFSLREAWSAIVTVGLRPCSGALLVLTFSLLNGLFLGGVLSVVAMSVGTAVTVSILATLAVTAKGAALRIAGHGSKAAAWTGHTIEILGALLVIATGVLLLGASLQG
ncbi:nickel/cobalt transporter [Rhizobium sp. RAF56]|uniref:nickel/cobalt transporter n=1 Tax=Rhizobium sp. RAF56 TaxID=3233062 RepID=UPI003F95F653